MKHFDTVALELEQCRAQLDEFRVLLASRAELGEAADVLPFFRARPQLAVLLGMFNSRIAWADRIAYEFDVFGDFACDLAVGQWSTGAYCFIEFEDARPNSVFEQKGAKATREWGRRFDHGFSQVVDWCYKLDRTSGADLVGRFGRPEINFEAVLVIGRDQHLSAGEKLRLDWRTDHVLVNSRKVYCMTFDHLLNELATRFSVLAAVASRVPGQVPPSP
jgi:hypothetical protein